MRFFQSLCQLFCVCLPFAISAQNLPNDVLLRINGKDIGTEEFKYLYNKNYKDSETAYTQESLQAYLELFIHFKLKVAAAQQLDLDKKPTFLQEFSTYQKQLARPYLTDQEMVEQMIRQAYDRMKTEVRASHLLIKVDPNATSADTLTAWQKINDLKKRTANGEDFAQLAQQFSEDPSAARNQGDLGFFTALQMVHEFEDAAFQTPVGAVVGPVRTRFGYHLLKVTDKRPAHGSYRTAHIMIRDMSGQANSEAKRKAEEIYQLLANGGAWEEICAKYSEDPSTKDKGGELPWFSAGTMVPEFAEAAFRLKDIGEISAPVQTPYGWHLIKLLEIKPIESFEALEPTIRRKVAQDGRAMLSQKAFVQKLKQTSGFREYPKNLDKALGLVDSTLANGKWVFQDSTSKKWAKPVFVIGKKTIATKQLLQYWAKQQQPQPDNRQATQYARTLYQQFVDETLLAHEEQQLEQKHPEYRNLLREYREGLLLFQIMEDSVWNLAVQDTAGVRDFYESRIDQYQWKRRYEVIDVEASNAALLDSLQRKHRSGFFEVPNMAPTVVEFDLNSNAWGAENVAKMEKVRDLARSRPDLILGISGWAAPKETRGTVALRLDKILAYLQGNGIPADRIPRIENAGKLPATKENPKPKGYVEVKLLSNSLVDLVQQFNASNPLALQFSQKTWEEGELPILEKTAKEVGSYAVSDAGRHHYIQIVRVLSESPKQLEEIRGQVIADYQNQVESEWLKRLKVRYQVQLNEAALRQMVKP